MYWKQSSQGKCDDFFGGEGGQRACRGYVKSKPNQNRIVSFVLLFWYNYFNIALSKCDLLMCGLQFEGHLYFARSE